MTSPDAANQQKPFDRYWRVRRTLPHRYGKPCRILIRGKMNSCMIEFQDGYRTITSRWSVRKIKPQTVSKDNEEEAPQGPDPALLDS